MNVDEVLATRDARCALAWADTRSRFDIEAVPISMLYELGFAAGFSAGLAAAKAMMSEPEQ